MQRESDPRDVRGQRLAICILECCSNVESALPEGADTGRKDLEVFPFMNKIRRKLRRESKVNVSLSMTYDRAMMCCVFIPPKTVTAKSRLSRHVFFRFVLPDPAIGQSSCLGYQIENMCVLMHEYYFGRQFLVRRSIEAGQRDTICKQYR